MLLINFIMKIIFFNLKIFLYHYVNPVIFLTLQNISVNFTKNISGGDTMSVTVTVSQENFLFVFILYDKFVRI